MIKSKRQWEKFHELHRAGKLSDDSLAREIRGVTYNELPERHEKENRPKTKRIKQDPSSPHPAHKPHPGWEK